MNGLLYNYLFAALTIFHKLAKESAFFKSGVLSTNFNFSGNMLLIIASSKCWCETLALASKLDLRIYRGMLLFSIVFYLDS